MHAAALAGTVLQSLNGAQRSRCVRTLCERSELLIGDVGAELDLENRVRSTLEVISRPLVRKRRAGEGSTREAREGTSGFRGVPFGGHTRGERDGDSEIVSDKIGAIHDGSPGSGRLVYRTAHT